MMKYNTEELTYKVLRLRLAGWSVLHISRKLRVNYWSVCRCLNSEIREKEARQKRERPIKGFLACAKQNHHACITPEHVIQAHIDSTGACAITRSSEKCHLDHCHQTGEFRGYILRALNSALGCLDDNQERLLQLATYVSKELSTLRFYQGLNQTNAGKKFKGKKCEVCGKSTGRLCIDHCHDTGLCRGTLCVNCNMAEGSIRTAAEQTGLDFIEVVNLLNAYLRQAPLQSFLDTDEYRLFCDEWPW